MTAAAQQCQQCAYGLRCDVHRLQRAPNFEVRRDLRLVCSRVESMIESHRWARRVDHNGKGRPELRCLDCWAVIVWDPSSGVDPETLRVARCPGKTVVNVSEAGSKRLRFGLPE